MSEAISVQDIASYVYIDDRIREDPNALIGCPTEEGRCCEHGQTKDDQEGAVLAECPCRCSGNIRWGHHRGKARSPALRLCRDGLGGFD